MKGIFRLELCRGVMVGKYCCGSIPQNARSSSNSFATIAIFECSAQAEFSGVYSRTSGAQQWIEQQVCELSSSVNKPSYCSENNGGLTEEPEDEPDEDPEEDPVTPPGKSDCVDSDTDTFLVDEALGNRGCNFLKDEMEQYGYLCKFVDVAFVCPDLCEICNRIEEFNQ
jgi:hypothetical protein